LSNTKPTTDNNGADTEAPILQISHYGVAFGSRVILAEIDLEINKPGVTALMGPTGTGKSTLLRSLAGANDTNPHFRTWGRIEYLGQLLAGTNRPALVAQNVQLLQAKVVDHLAEQLRAAGTRLAPLKLRQSIEDRLVALGCTDLLEALDVQTAALRIEQQRRVAILGEAIGNPSLILIDEPTANLKPADAEKVLGLISRLGEEMAVLLILHNQEHARSFADDIVLLAGGRVQAKARSYEFSEKLGAHVASFIHTGGCNLPSPDADPECLADDVERPPPLPLAARLAVRSEPEYRGPHDFRWIIPGRLATTPLPGAVIDINYDLAALRVVGITTLITLTRRDLDQERLEQHGLRNLHLPIYDREPPTIPQLRMLAIRMSAMIDEGEVLAVHCRAGIGRTGTIVAGWLIHEGLTASAALERIRAINPKFVQTIEQEEFLTKFEEALLQTV
jgi:atypical dual specificity phosphatase